MPAAIIGLLTALPQLLTTIQQLGVTFQSMWTWLEKVSGNDPAGYLVKIGVAFNTLTQAKTPKEHSDAAHDLADLFRGLH